MTDATDARMAFKNAFIRHYRTERDRSEKCLGDIIEVLQDKDLSDEQRNNAILDRIIKHYDRS